MAETKQPAAMAADGDAEDVIYVTVPVCVSKVTEFMKRRKKMCDDGIIPLFGGGGGPGRAPAPMFGGGGGPGR